MTDSPYLAALRAMLGKHHDVTLLGGHLAPLAENLERAKKLPDAVLHVPAVAAQGALKLDIERQHTLELSPDRSGVGAALHPLQLVPYLRLWNGCPAGREVFMREDGQLARVISARIHAQTLRPDVHATLLGMAGVLGWTFTAGTDTGRSPAQAAERHLHRHPEQERVTVTLPAGVLRAFMAAYHARTTALPVAPRPGDDQPIACFEKAAGEEPTPVTLVLNPSRPAARPRATPAAESPEILPVAAGPEDQSFLAHATAMQDAIAHAMRVPAPLLAPQGAPVTQSDRLPDYGDDPTGRARLNQFLIRVREGLADTTDVVLFDGEAMTLIGAIAASRHPVFAHRHTTVSVPYEVAVRATAAPSGLTVRRTCHPLQPIPTLALINGEIGAIFTGVTDGELYAHGRDGTFLPAMPDPVGLATVLGWMFGWRFEAARHLAPNPTAAARSYFDAVTQVWPSTTVPITLPASAVRVLQTALTTGATPTTIPAQTNDRDPVVIAYAKADGTFVPAQLPDLGAAPLSTDGVLVYSEPRPTPAEPPAALRDPLPSSDPLIERLVENGQFDVADVLRYRHSRDTLYEAYDKSSVVHTTPARRAELRHALADALRRGGHSDRAALKQLIDELSQEPLDPNGEMLLRVSVAYFSLIPAQAVRAYEALCRAYKIDLH